MTDEAPITIDAGALPITIHAQYIKDLSFENPSAPASLRGGPGPQDLDISFSIDSKQITTEQEARVYEVILGIKATAKRDDKIVFIAELAYGTVVSMKGVPQEHEHPLLFIEIPRQAFPFARQILSALTQQAGYPPLLLAPVDFRAFYAQRFGKEAAA